MKRILTLNNSTYAINQGNIKLDKKVWFRYHKAITLMLFLFMVILIIMALTIDLFLLIFVVVSMIMNFYYWLSKTEFFAYGACNNGVVVSNNPKLVAIKTDLSKGFGHYPVVKIIKCKQLKKLNVGDKVPTVALYSDSNEALPNWIDFHPVPIFYATNDVNVIKQTVERFSENDWQKLEEYLLKIKKPYKIGLYKIFNEESDWQKLAIQQRRKKYIMTIIIVSIILMLFFAHIIYQTII